MRHAELHEFASTDTLTGLLNRRGLAERTCDFTPRRTGKDCVGVIMLDLDHFKLVNDQHGHDAGDAVFVETGQRLQTLFRPADAIVRLGGDEFAVILGKTNNADATAAVARVLTVMQQRYGYKGRLLTVGTSVGVAIQNDQDRTFPDLLARADGALYAAKQAGRGVWRIAA
jgi:diguanylate cyclase